MKYRSVGHGAALVLAFSLLSGVASAQEACPATIAAVRGVETRWLAAYETRDTRAMDAILADGFTITHPSGRLETREAVLAGVERRRGTPGPRFSTSEVQGRCYRDTVILTGVVVAAGSEDRPSRYTDTYVRTAGGWRVAASHLSDVRAQRPQS